MQNCQFRVALVLPFFFAIIMNIQYTVVSRNLHFDNCIIADIRCVLVTGVFAIDAFFLVLVSEIVRFGNNDF